MTQAAIDISRTGLRLIHSAKFKASAALNKKISKAELIFLGVTLAFIQVLDGLLTTVGVMNFGPQIEANVLIRTLIEAWGVVPALFTIKSAAIVIVITLCVMANRVFWLANALKGIIVLYLLAAIIPWSIILAFNVA